MSKTGEQRSAVERGYKFYAHHHDTCEISMGLTLFCTCGRDEALSAFEQVVEQVDQEKLESQVYYAMARELHGSHEIVARLAIAMKAAGIKAPTKAPQDNEEQGGG